MSTHRICWDIEARAQARLCESSAPRTNLLTGLVAVTLALAIAGGILLGLVQP